jgi:predicted ATP-dependent endonuclease of OLD family
MQYKSIKIKGLRGFEIEQELNIAIPNGDPGSGLTIVVGPNNSGKSTIYESFRAISQQTPPSFTEGKRNKKAGDKISIELTQSDGHNIRLKTSNALGSETFFEENGISKDDVKIHTLPSRRTFNPFFGKGTWKKQTYMRNSTLPSIRGQELSGFNHRIFEIQENQEKFNTVLGEILNPIPQWNIDQNDSGQYYIKFNYDGSFHNSDGAGEGLISIFTIIDTLYDSEKNDMIVIDEPELSLHPSLQRKMSNLLIKYSSNRQIIISTHSPFFINWGSLLNGGKLARTVKHNGTIKINNLRTETVESLRPLFNNLNNPHTFGLNANEIFFLDDNVILTEGQEDVIFLKRIINMLRLEINANFFGWGVGGATNLEKILNLMKDLGFINVATILDNNVSELKNTLSKKFPNYFFECIPTDDVRDKPERKGTKAIVGLIDQGGKNIKEEHILAIRELFNNINEKMK